MAGIATAIAGGALLGTAVLRNSAQKSAANKAASATTAASDASIAEQQRQFDTVQKLLEPYVTGGNSAFSRMLDISGANGNDSQQSAISGIQNSALFQGLVKQGENSILQNASATGGLRGGNVNQALEQ